MFAVGHRPADDTRRHAGRIIWRSFKQGSNLGANELGQHVNGKGMSQHMRRHIQSRNQSDNIVRSPEQKSLPRHRMSWACPALSARGSWERRPFHQRDRAGLNCVHGAQVGRQEQMSFPRLPVLSMSDEMRIGQAVDGANCS